MTKKITFLIAAALMLLTMIVSPGRAVGQTKGSVTYTFSDHYSSNTVLDATAISLDASIQATFNKRTGGTATQYYTNGTAVRWYGGGTLLIEAKTGSNATITNITINYTQTANSVSASVGTYSLSNNVGTWTGSAPAVTFTQSGTTGQCRISAISVTYSTGGSTAVATPTITPNSGSFLTSQEVSIACATADATIYYTTDGSNPTTSSTQYTEAFTVTETTTVKAFAVKSGLDNSQVATATYTKATVMTVAEARDAIDDGTGTQGVYVTGIVSQIVTPWGQNNYQNITFNIVDQSGDEEFLQAFRCVGDEAPNVAVDDIVVVYGNLTKYQTTYEFAQGCQVVSLTHPTITVATPTFNPEGGIYNEAQNVTLSCATDGASIYYTTDGSTPDNTSTPYNNAINVTSTTTIKAIAYVGTDASSVASATYTIISFADISSITEVGTAYMVRGTVVATNSRGFVMGDGTGYVYYYKGSDAGKNVGDMVTLSGTTGTYGQIIQFTNSATVEEATTSNYNNTPAATVITEVPDYTEGYHLSTYFEFTGALSKTGSNYLITLGDAQIQISYPTSDQGTALTALDGKTAHVKGYFSGINSGNKFTVMLESAEEVVVPSITVNPDELHVDAEFHYIETADGLDITYENLTITDKDDFGVQFYDANNQELQEEPDWVGLYVWNYENGYKLVGNIYANNGEARTAYFKVWAEDDNSNKVYSNLVTVNQDAIIDYATLPFFFDNNVVSSTVGLSKKGSISSYTSSPGLCFISEGSYVILKTNESPATLSYHIKGDNFYGGTFKVQTSADGVTYTDLKTYTSLSDEILEESFNNIAEDVRYIKWTYTEKANGFVGLGFIEATNGSGPVEKYTVTFDVNEGSTVQTDDFPFEVNTKLPGTYTLPLATSSRLFTGWDDGTNIYQYNTQYTGTQARG